MNLTTTGLFRLSNPTVFTRGGLAAALALLLAATALFMTACGGEESALPPADTSSSAGSAAAAAPPPASAATPPPAAAASGASSSPAANSAPSSSAPSSSAPPAAAAAEPINVVASNPILANLVSNVGGDRVAVNSLVPLGSDVHTWQSTPQDSVRITEADVIVSNGAGLAAQVEQLIDNVASPETIQVIVSDGLEAQELLEMAFPEGDHDDHDDHDEAVELHGRLLIGDGESGAMSIIDLETGAVHQGEFDLGSRAGRIYSSAGGRFAIAVSSDANKVHIFDGGIYLEEHGDHYDLVEEELSRLDINLIGDRPVHLYVGDEWSTVFYDDSGDVALISEHELEHDGAAYAPTMFNAGPQHGAAVPLDDDLFAITIQHPQFTENPTDYRLPIGAEIWDLDGNVLYRAEGCPDLHGDASNGHMAAFGCTGGVLAVGLHHDHYEHIFVPAPAGSPSDFRLTSVWGYHGLDHFFALGSAVGLYVVEPEAGEMELLIPATDTLRPIQVALSYDGERLLVVMSDGELRMYEAHDLDLLASVSGILSPDLDPGFWARPHLATAPGHIFITDSAAGEVLALDDHDLEEVGHWEVSGKPTKIAFVGILDADDDHDDDHDDHDDHDDDHDDHDHGHDHGEGDPHFWLNPRLVVHYVNQIANGLAAADPANAATYQANTAAYIRELEMLDAYIADTTAGIPKERRIIVTFHDAFGYFGTRYDFELMAFVGGHGGEVSPDDIANVLELVRDRGIPAVFAEQQFSADALEQVARDTGIRVGIIRSVPDATHSDYLGMMRANADAIAAELR